MRSRVSLVLVALLCLLLAAFVSVGGCAPLDGGDEATPIEIPGDEVTGDEATPIEIPGDEVTGDEATPIEIPGDDVTGDEASEEAEEEEVQAATPIEIPGDDVTDE